VVEHGHRPGEVREEDEAGLEGCDQERLQAVVVGRDLGAELVDSALNLVSAEVDLTDPAV
jgi:hypothetical protein